MSTLTLTAEQTVRGPLVLINRTHPIGEDASPTLVPLGESGVLLERQAACLLTACFQKLDAEGRIVPVSGWRSQAEQQAIWDGSLAEHGASFTRQFVALPGCSEHQTGLAIDLGLGGPEVDFLCPNFPYEGICQQFRGLAPSYGFIERYPEGKEAVTGIAHEPWHFRYVGVPHAELMTARGWTLEEYLLRLEQHPSGREPLRWRSGAREYRICYVSVGREAVPFQPEEGCRCLLSGNNAGGVVITQWKDVEPT